MTKQASLNIGHGFLMVLGRSVLALVLLAGLSGVAFAAIGSENSYELTCRAKAKEIAADTYRECVTENKKAEIEKIRKDYKERLRALKEDYEKEIETLGVKSTKNNKKAEPAKSSATNIVADAKSSIKPSMMNNDDGVLVKNMRGSDTMSDDSQMDIPEPIPVERISKGKN